MQSDIDAAISAALSLDWPKAVEINSKILAECPDDTDCLNRIGKAYLELGDSKKAIKFFRKVLKINKYDPIATKNLMRALQSGSARKKDGHENINHQNSKLSNNFKVNFIEEPGKTKVITLVNLAPAKALMLLNHADSVQLCCKRHSVLVIDLQGTYLGALPDDIGHRLLILIKGGNKYEGSVKSVGKNLLTVFVKETFRAKKFHNTPSFPTSGSDYLSFVREESYSIDEPSVQVAPESDESDEAPSKAETMHRDEILEDN